MPNTDDFPTEYDAIVLGTGKTPDFHHEQLILCLRKIQVDDTTSSTPIQSLPTSSSPA